MLYSLAKEQLNKNVLLAVLAKITVKKGSIFYKLALLAKFVYKYVGLRFYIAPSGLL